MTPKKTSTALILVIVCLLVILLGLLAALFALRWDDFFSAETTAPSTQTTEPTTKPTEPTTKPTDPTTKPTEPTEPPIVKVGTATIANVGDLLMHLPVINSADIQMSRGMGKGACSDFNDDAHNGTSGLFI